MTVNPGVNTPRWLIISLQIPNKVAISWLYTLRKAIELVDLLIKVKATGECQEIICTGSRRETTREWLFLWIAFGSVKQPMEDVEMMTCIGRRENDR